jgi:hypothetical protein
MNIIVANFVSLSKGLLECKDANYVNLHLPGVRVDKEEVRDSSLYLFWYLISILTQFPYQPH